MLGWPHSACSSRQLHNSAVQATGAHPLQFQLRPARVATNAAAYASENLTHKPVLQLLTTTFTLRHKRSEALQASISYRTNFKLLLQAHAERRAQLFKHRFMPWWAVAHLLAAAAGAR